MSREVSDELLREYDALVFEFERRGGWDVEFERNRVANGLEIPEAQRSQLFKMLSGGEKTRVNLARLILEDTDILLLDEPTNHLDINATEWLESYLSKFKGTVSCHFARPVFSRQRRDAHDRDHQGKAEFYGGNYSFYVVEKQRLYDEQLKQIRAESRMPDD
jgi:ATPase subunit of ABC transporter with duplicated ATPase domains